MTPMGLIRATFFAALHGLAVVGIPFPIIL
jgi:hypothetical protein